MNGLSATESVLTVKGVVEDNQLSGCCWITLQVSEKKSESKSGAVAGTEGVFEARSIPRCFTVTKINGRVIDNKLIARCSDAARVGVLGLSDVETSIEHGQMVIDPPLVRFHHGLQRDKQAENPASIRMRTRGWGLVGRA